MVSLCRLGWDRGLVSEEERPSHLWALFGMNTNFGTIGIGRHISFLEMNKIIPMIVTQFDLELVRKTDVLETENYWFVKPKDFRVVVRPRQISSGR